MALRWRSRSGGGAVVVGDPTIYVQRVALHGGGHRYSPAVRGLVPAFGPNGGDFDTLAEAKRACEAYMEAELHLRPYAERAMLRGPVGPRCARAADPSGIVAAPELRGDGG